MRIKLLSLLCALSIMFSCVPASFALEGESQRAADTLITLGLLEGLDGGTYDFSQPAQRQNAVVLLAVLSGAKPNKPKVNSFLEAPDAAADYAVSQGWIDDAGATASALKTPVTANQWFTALLRMLGYRDSANEFRADAAAVFARRIGLASRAYTASLTLGDLFESALDALRFPYRDGKGTVIEVLTQREICAPSAVNALGFNQAELSARQISDRYMSAVIGLALYDSENPVGESESYADASAFFINADGLALTNYHSISGAAQAVAVLITGEQCFVERVVWYDTDMDLAVIRVSKTTLSGQQIPMFAYLELVGTTDLRPGDIAYTLSNPLGLGLAVSSGVISATARAVERYKLPCVMNTADISQGSSGGALLNAFGHVIAVTSGAYRVGNSMYLAVPVDIVPTLDLSGAGNTLAEVRAVELAKAEAEAQKQQDEKEGVQPSETEEEPEAARAQSNAQES